MEGEVPTERKSRKSVAFTDEQVVVDADGSVTMVNATEEPKDSAQSHTPRTPPLSAALESFTDSQTTAAEDLPPGDDDFTKQLEKLELKEGEEVEEIPQEQEGDMNEGTGIWAHDETKTIGYSMLLSRFFHQLTERNPDHTSPGTKSYKIPPPQCMREGNRKTVFANIADISKRMKRTEEHLTAYLFAELGTSGSVDGSRRLVIKGRFQQKQIENVVRKYIIEYVTCKTCKSPDTELNKGENRLYFITCNNCGSRRSVTAIKTGFSAQVGKRRKMQG
ncbi:Translation initiation factor IF2/IF5 domain [Fusarium oxysporum f. sp. vasinfectum]|nr:Translation initiation factor IF2/IF5 domain [Fusarium oxysporum f. sp. vasinfectum]KAK2934294.1 Translation initiation factor IF2/IF5 domain [Fusarium oxysporum f. sp. vasinfectum]